MTAFRSLLFNLFFFPWTAVISLAMIPLLPFPRRATHEAVRLWAKGNLLGLRVLVGLNYEARGLENVVDGAAIYAAKHQSAWDTFAFYMFLTQPCYVLKKELLRIPFWSWYARKGGALSVDRDGGGRALKKLVRDTQYNMSENLSVIIFPEGTRTEPGRHIPYFPGIAAMYSRAGVPVIPVAVNSGLFWGRRSFKKYAGAVIIEFLPALPPGLPRAEFMERLETTVEAASLRLAEEAVERYPQVAGNLRPPMETAAD